MWARVTGMATAVLFGLSMAGRAGAQARTAPMVGVATLSVTVPSFVRTVVDPTLTSASGAPIVHVITNDPAIRAFLADLAPVEVARQGGDPGSVTGHAKGAEQVSGEGTDGRVLRYTVVAP